MSHSYMPLWVKDGAEAIVLSRGPRQMDMRAYIITRHTASTVWVHPQINGKTFHHLGERRFRLTKAGLTEAGYAGRIDAPALMEATAAWKMEMFRLNAKPIAVVAVERWLMARNVDNAKQAIARLDEWVTAEEEAVQTYIANTNDPLYPKQPD